MKKFNFMLGRLVFFVLIVFLFVNTDQSIAGSYITKKSEVTKEEKKLKKEYIKKKKKVEKENKKEFIKKKKKLSDKAKSWITKKSLTSLSKYYSNINELPKANFYFFAKNKNGVTYIGYIKDDKTSKILTKDGINIKKEQKGKAYLLDAGDIFFEKVICNIHSEIKDFQVINSKILAMRSFSLGCTKGNKNDKILGYWTQRGNSGDGDIETNKNVRFEVKIFKDRKNASLVLSDSEKERTTHIASPLQTYRTEEKYYALIIGNSEYDDRRLDDLIAPVNDARALNDVLKTKYNFETELLLNATREEILDKMQDIASKLNRKDNLLIYYGGHGMDIQEQEIGYWLPIDADKEKRSKWINTQSVADEIKYAKAKHILLIVDSCFSGSLTKSTSANKNKKIKKGDKKYNVLSKKKARWLISSGGIEPVDDSDGRGHSYFARKLIDVLKENKPGQVITSYELFEPIHTYVTDNLTQNPERVKIVDTGHAGGDFLFYAKVE